MKIVQAYSDEVERFIRNKYYTVIIQFLCEQVPGIDNSPLWLSLITLNSDEYLEGHQSRKKKNELALMPRSVCKALRGSRALDWIDGQ